MFKNYLTYSFAQNFQLATRSLEAPASVEASIAARFKERLGRSADTMLHHFARSIYTQDPKEESKFLFVALTCLRDCREILAEGGHFTGELAASYEILHARLEQICLQRATEAEDGQLRMLG